ncbi:hypothetical protein [Ralstonia solanacearum]|uniref:Uncharacterized protein n=1 Tax=Ralstonia solanacearum TaxID=305 RepID=A0AAD0SHD9_RALSL|nr:hypothetical protein [Ralstonia solanacearum]AXV84502.1 hypothetical protein CJO77_23780 [Ralstonia solanacearum]AXW55630.1 hypothetical protein CJO92_23795 [Ralstonia solanacearum]
MPLDLSKTSLDDLVAIHNEVLRNIALQTKVNLEGLASAGHDSHSSNHSNNKITDVQAQVQQLVRQQR